MIDVKSIVEEPLNTLWEKYKNKIFRELPPLYPKEVKKNAIVFIGVNPSIKKGERKRIIENKENEPHFYDLHNSRMQLPYFKKFEDVAKQTHLDWTHLDLLYLRKTSQKKVKEILKEKGGTDFIQQQLLITKPIICKLLKQKRKTIFVVNNAWARTLLGKDKTTNKKGEDINVWLDYTFEWNEEYGTYTLLGNPFFFCCMLSGQGPLDLGSYKRLTWHILQVKLLLNWELKSKELEEEFNISGLFYTLGKRDCRKYLNIKRKNTPLEKPDLMVIMMNPGGAAPLNKEDSLDQEVAAVPDKTQYQIMKLMNILGFSYVRVLNLSDLREAKSKEFRKKLTSPSIQKLPHSIFDVKREQDFDAHFEKKVPILMAWGVHKGLKPLAEKAMAKLKGMKTFSYAHSDGGVKYYHPLPKTELAKKEWLKQVVKNYQETK